MAGRALQPLRVPDGFWSREDVRGALRRRDFGELFKLVARYAGASQTQIAIAVGMTQGQVSDFMRRAREVTAIDVAERTLEGLEAPDAARIAFGLAPRNAVIPAASVMGSSLVADVSQRGLNAARTDVLNVNSSPDAVAIVHDDLATPAAGLAADDVSDAFELARRASASDIGDTTLAGLERAVDKLAVAYQSTAPAVLLSEIRRHLHYVGQLVDKRATLAQRRRVLVVGGWLSLLASTVEIDLQRRFPAGAHLAAAASLAEHTDNRELAAWCLETEAWDALTEGQFKRAVALSQAAQAVAPRNGSAFIQATAQEGRAWARLGQRREARDALARVERLASPLAVPDQPEHHYRYDPAKQVAYTATTLSWLADPAAERQAREILGRLESARDGGRRPRRTATARIDLALALVAVGNLDEAAEQTLIALRSGYIVPSSAWRAAEILAAVEAAGLPEAAILREAMVDSGSNGGG